MTLFYFWLGKEAEEYHDVTIPTQVWMDQERLIIQTDPQPKEIRWRDKQNPESWDN